MSFNFQFDSRSSYLIAVAEWKAIYAAHSQKIRDTRKQFRHAQSEESKGQGDWREVSRLRAEVESLRDQATALIDQRHASKREAQRQYEAVHQARVAVA